MFKKIFKNKIQEILPYILIVGAIIGLFVSLTLTIEHINFIKNPDHRLNCSFDPVLSCGPVINSDQAKAFGFPNPLIGLAVFGAQLLLGIAMLAGAKMKSWFWKLYGIGILGGISFTLWLMFETIYRINALCIYCIGAWIVEFTIAWYVFQFMLAGKHINLNKKFTNFIRKHHLNILLAWFAIVVALILNHFWYFYGSKLGF